MIAPVRFDVGHKGGGLLGDPVYTAKMYDSKLESLKDILWANRRWHQVIHEPMVFLGSSWMVVGLCDELHDILLSIDAGDYSLRNGESSRFQRPYLELYDSDKAMMFRLASGLPTTADFPVRIDD